VQQQIADNIPSVVQTIIDNDAQYQQLMNNKFLDIHAINSRIRSIINDHSNYSHNFQDVLTNERYYPVMQDDHTFKKEKWNDYHDPIVDAIEGDAQYQELMNAQPQNPRAINERIRQIASNMGIYLRNIQEELPQISPAGQWTMVKYSEPNPIEDRQTRIWQDTPHPQSAHTHVPRDQRDPAKVAKHAEVHLARRARIKLAKREARQEARQEDNQEDTEVPVS
jgi:hypothetical protein